MTTLFEVTHYEDGDKLYVNLNNILMLKLHPSITKPKCAVFRFIGDPEKQLNYITLESYHAILERTNGSASS